MRITPAVLLAFVLLATSLASPSQTSFTSVQLQKRTLEETMQNMRTGHSGGDGGSQGEGNDQSTSTTQPGRPLNGAGTAYSRNHPQHGAGVYSSTTSILITSIILALELYVFM